jgi:hypothetical protein
MEWVNKISAGASGDSVFFRVMAVVLCKIYNKKGQSSQVKIGCGVGAGRERRNPRVYDRSPFQT